MIDRREVLLAGVAMVSAPALAKAVTAMPVLEPVPVVPEITQKMLVSGCGRFWVEVATDSATGLATITHRTLGYGPA